MPLTVNQEDAGSNPVVHPNFNAALAQLAEATDSNPVQFRFESGERYQVSMPSSFSRRFGSIAKEGCK